MQTGAITQLSPRSNGEIIPPIDNHSDRDRCRVWIDKQLDNLLKEEENIHLHSTKVHWKAKVDLLLMVRNRLVGFREIEPINLKED